MPTLIEPGVCSKGHDTGRYVSTGRCVACAKETRLRQWQNNRASVLDGNKSYYERNRERLCARSRELYTKNAERQTNLRNIRKYGIDLAEIDRMWDIQGGKCAICVGDMVREGRGQMRCVVDHDHKTNVVRSLLCSHCNRAVGLFKEDPARMRAGAAYIERHNQQQPQGEPHEHTDHSAAC